MTSKTVYVENATRDETIAVRIDSDWRAAVIRKLDDNLYAINTRKGSREATGRERLEVGPASRATDAAWCKAHEHYKIVTPSGALYCRACSRTYLKDWSAKKRAGEITSKTPEQRAAEREAKQDDMKKQAAEQRAAALQKHMEQGLRRTEAFFLDSARKHGEAAARSTYSRYLTDERMDALLAQAAAA